MRLALPAPYPTSTLGALGGREESGHHATWLPRISRILADFDNLDVHWLTCTKDVSEPRVIEERGQTFHLVPRGSLGFQILTSFHHERRELSKRLAFIQPDLVHAWGTEQGYGYTAIDWPGAAILSIQGILTECCRVCPQPWLMRLQARHERRVLEKARFLTVESAWGRALLQEKASQARIELLEYGVDPVFFDLVRQPAAKPIALYIGSLSTLKGVDTLLDVFHDPRLADINLHVYGVGDKRFTSTSGPPNVRFFGFCPKGKMLSALSEAWCLVHPTRADTSPNAVKEARVVGLPVVTTTNGGQTAYVTHGESGFLHPVNDREALIEGILTVTQDRETSLRMGAAGRDACRRILGLQETATKLFDLYQVYSQ